jgi:phospho-N-acetylmuramoyl-pentapeptide-transferase
VQKLFYNGWFDHPSGDSCAIFVIGKIDNVYILMLLTVWMGCIGFIDDYIKIFRKNKQGLKAKFKLFGQVVWIDHCINDAAFIRMLIRLTPEEAASKGYAVMNHVEIHDKTVPGEWKDMVYCKSSLTNVPFFKEINWIMKTLLIFLEKIQKLDMDCFYSDHDHHHHWVSNGANLTDGLDGLATGVSAIIALALAILAYVSGNTIIADYLNIFYIPYSGELVVFSGCFLGAYWISLVQFLSRKSIHG